jgi:hypothetical protein
VLQKRSAIIADALEQPASLRQSEHGPSSDPAVPFLFRCPITGSGVQGFLIEETPCDDPNSFDAVRCLDCGQIHLVNFRTRKTVGQVPRDR